MLHIPTRNHWMIAFLVPMDTIVFKVQIRQIAPKATTVLREPKHQIRTHVQWVSILIPLMQKLRVSVSLAWLEITALKELQLLSLV
jgi:hypothetical protein